MIAWWLWVSAGAFAGSTTKVEKSLAAAQAGDAEAWADARERLDKLLDKSPDDAALQVLAGRMWMMAATRGATDTGKVPAEQALLALEAATKATLVGEARASAEASLGQLASLLVADLTNQVEGKQWAEARTAVALCERALAAGAVLGVRDPARTATFEKLATQVSLQAKDLAGAKDHYGRLREATGAHDTTLAAKVAKKLAELESPAAALGFLDPIVDAAPTDEALLRAWVELALAGNDVDRGVARLDAVYTTLVGSKSGAVLLGELYDAAGRKEKARGAYEALLAAEPSNIPANLALSRFWLASARATLAQLDGEAGARRPSREVAKIVASAASDLALADARAVAATEADASHAEAWTFLVEVLQERLARIPSPPKATADKNLAKALGDRLATAQGKLAALKEGA